MNGCVPSCGRGASPGRHRRHRSAATRGDATRPVVGRLDILPEDAASAASAACTAGLATHVRRAHCSSRSPRPAAGERLRLRAASVRRCRARLRLGAPSSVTPASRSTASRGRRSRAQVATVPARGRRDSSVSTRRAINGDESSARATPATRSPRAPAPSPPCVDEPPSRSCAIAAREATTHPAKRRVRRPSPTPTATAGPALPPPRVATCRRPAANDHRTRAAGCVPGL